MIICVKFQGVRKRSLQHHKQILTPYRSLFYKQLERNGHGLSQVPFDNFPNFVQMYQHFRY